MNVSCCNCDWRFKGQSLHETHAALLVLLCHIYFHWCARSYCNLEHRYFFTDFFQYKTKNGTKQSKNQLKRIQLKYMSKTECNPTFKITFHIICFRTIFIQLIRKGIFPSKTNRKNLDVSKKMDLDFLRCFGKKKKNSCRKIYMTNLYICVDF